MAIYGSNQFLYKDQGRADEFKALHNPGTKAPFPGIYRCAACGFEVVSEKDKPLPPQDNWHRHEAPILWLLLVRAYYGQILGP